MKTKDPPNSEASENLFSIGIYYKKKKTVQDQQHLGSDKFISSLNLLGTNQYSVAELCTFSP